MKISFFNCVPVAKITKLPLRGAFYILSLEKVRKAVSAVLFLSMGLSLATLASYQLGVKAVVILGMGISPTIATPVGLFSLALFITGFALWKLKIKIDLVLQDASQLSYSNFINKWPYGLQFIQAWDSGIYKTLMLRYVMDKLQGCAEAAFKTHRDKEAIEKYFSEFEKILEEEEKNAGFFGIDRPTLEEKCREVGRRFADQYLTDLMDRLKKRADTIFKTHRNEETIKTYLSESEKILEEEEKNAGFFGIDRPTLEEKCREVGRSFADQYLRDLMNRLKKRADTIFKTHRNEETIKTYLLESEKILEEEEKNAGFFGIERPTLEEKCREVGRRFADQYLRDLMDRLKKRADTIFKTHRNEETIKTYLLESEKILEEEEKNAEFFGIERPTLEEKCREVGGVLSRLEGYAEIFKRDRSQAAVKRYLSDTNAIFKYENSILKLLGIEESSFQKKRKEIVQRFAEHYLKDWVDQLERYAEVIKSEENGVETYIGNVEKLLDDEQSSLEFFGVERSILEEKMREIGKKVLMSRLSKQLESCANTLFQEGRSARALKTYLSESAKIIEAEKGFFERLGLDCSFLDKKCQRIGKRVAVRKFVDQLDKYAKNVFKIDRNIQSVETYLSESAKVIEAEKGFFERLGLDCSFLDKKCKKVGRRFADQYINDLIQLLKNCTETIFKTYSNEKAVPEFLSKREEILQAEQKCLEFFGVDQSILDEKCREFLTANEDAKTLDYLDFITKWNLKTCPNLFEENQNTLKEKYLSYIADEGAKRLENKESLDLFLRNEEGAGLFFNLSYEVIIEAILKVFESNQGKFSDIRDRLTRDCKELKINLNNLSDSRLKSDS